MLIQLTAEEFRRLSAAAQNEIIALATAAAPTCTNPGAASMPEGGAVRPIRDEGLVDLTVAQAKKFPDTLLLANKNALFTMIRNNGEIAAQELQAMGIRHQGFQTAMTRRVRTVTSDPEASLLGWDDAQWKWLDDGTIIGKYWISAATCQAFRVTLGLG